MRDKSKLNKVLPVIDGCAVLHNITKYLRDPDHLGEKELNQQIEKVEDEPEEQNTVEERSDKGVIYDLRLFYISFKKLRYVCFIITTVSQTQKDHH